MRNFKTLYAWQKSHEFILEIYRTTQDFPFLSGNMVRDMVMLKDNRYKEFVHPENIELIEKSFYEDENM